MLNTFECPFGAMLQGASAKSTSNIFPGLKRPLNCTCAVVVAGGAWFGRIGTHERSPQEGRKEGRKSPGRAGEGGGVGESLRRVERNPTR